ncbi:MAG: putative dehydrogenase [Candidatus Pelagisphaera sp.]|jgi:predicted dehydrogenase
MSYISRRRFLQNTSIAGASLLLAGTQSSGKVFGANDRLRIAVIGLNGRGKSHIAGWLEQPNVEIAYLVDPDKDVLAARLKDLQTKTQGRFTTKGLSDVRKALEDKNLDAISIATPNHWHSLMTIWGAQAGKHVYVEKPMSHDITEGRIAMEAQKKYGVVVQHGTQRRSDEKIAGLTEMIHAGHFGKLKISYGYACKPRQGIGFKSPGTAPRNLDWNLWKGPAIIDSYSANLAHYNWHWFWRTGNGEMNNQGTHQLDVARWAIDKDQTHPVRAMAIGGRFQWKDQGETPNTMFGIAQYPNGQYAFFNVRNVDYEGYERQVENEYYFEDGGKIVRDLYYSKGSSTGEKIDVKPGNVTPGGNWAAFIAACRAGDPSMANGDVADAHYGCVLGHLMNNSYRLGKSVPFNKKAGRFGDNEDANEHFGRLHDLMADGAGMAKDGEQYTVGPWLEFDTKSEKHVGKLAGRANALMKDENNRGFKVPTLAKL